MAEMDQDTVDQMQEMVDKYGIGQMLEHLTIVCAVMADECDIEDQDEEGVRQWRVRETGLIKALRDYTAYCKKHNVA
jgi:hypothetical protein